MFNMKQIGKKITELRKRNNMTQMELADKLNISFQAVSNWERGNTMPDIAKLPELATIFQTSIDELLSGNSSFIESIIEGTVNTYIEEGKLTENEVIDALPLLKPTQAEHILKKADVSSFEKISILLPYLSSDSIAELATAAIKNGTNVDNFLPYVDDFLPCIDEDVVADLAVIVLKKGLSIDNFIPYMDEYGANKLAVLTLEKGLPVDNFLPYIDEYGANELATLALEKGLPIDNFLPHMAEDDITELALKVLRKR